MIAIVPASCTYLYHDNQWLASTSLAGHPDLFRVEAVSSSADVHYLDWVTTAGTDTDIFGVVESSGYRTLRVSFTPWNAPMNPFALWETHKARAELLKWNLVGDETDPDYLMLLALPGSFSVARLNALQARYTDLMIEVV